MGEYGEREEKRKKLADDGQEEMLYVGTEGSGSLKGGGDRLASVSGETRGAQ